MARKKVNTIYPDKKPRKRFPVLQITAVALAITAIVLLSVLLTNIFGKEHLVSKVGGGKLVNPRNDVTYTLIMPCPYWGYVDTSEVYAECDGVEYYKIIYTDVDGKDKYFDPLKLIASYEDGILNLYAADGFKLPTLDELAPDTGFLYYVGKVEYPMGANLTQEDTNTIVNLLKTGEEAIFPSNADFDSMRIIRLASKNHIYIRYSVEYFATEDGQMYLHDIASGKYIKATEELSAIFGNPNGEVKE